MKVMLPRNANMETKTLGVIIDKIATKTGESIDSM